MKEVLKPYNTLEALIANVDLGTLAEAARQNALHAWLEEHFYYDQAAALSLDRIKIFDGDELRLALCEELQIDLMSLSEYDTRAIERALARRRKKLIYIDYDAGDPDGELAGNQTQLLDLIFKDCCSVIYLCGGEFQIPLNKRSMTYIGRNSAVINITGRERVDFDASDITLKNVTLYLRHITPEDVAIERSENVKFIIGKRIALDDELRRREIYKFLQGRDAFERFEEFEQRAAIMRGITIGEALLESVDFNIDNGVFELRPRWRVDYLKVIRNFAGDKHFSVFAAASVAKKDVRGRARSTDLRRFRRRRRRCDGQGHVFEAGGRRQNFNLVDGQAARSGSS